MPQMKQLGNSVLDRVKNAYLNHPLKTLAIGTDFSQDIFFNAIALISKFPKPDSAVKHYH
jgi:hypothetical protein